MLSDELINRVSQAYGRMKDFSAKIEQIQQFSSNQPQYLRGHVYLKSGRKALFDYASPRKQLEYFEGKNLIRFEPEINQVTYGTADADTLAILQIVGNREAPWKDQFKEKQTLDRVPLKKGDQVVRLIPHNKNLKEVLVEVDPVNFMIHRLVFTYAGGETNEFRFTDIKTDPLPPALFVFKEPKGATIRKQ